MAQLKRYLNGSKLSDDALEALESHLVECPVCRLAVQAQKVNTEPVLPTQAVVQTPAPTVEKKSLLNGHLKTLGLAIGLATVLVAMSMIANDPTKLFGDRLQDSKSTSKVNPNTPTAKRVESKPSQPVKTEPVVGSAEASRPEPVKKPEPESTTPPVKPEPKSPEPTQQAKPAAKSKPRTRPTPRKPAPQPTSNASGIRVYDQNGNPI